MVWQKRFLRLRSSTAAPTFFGNWIRGEWDVFVCGVGCLMWWSQSLMMGRVSRFKLHIANIHGLEILSHFVLLTYSPKFCFIANNDVHLTKLYSDAQRIIFDIVRVTVRTEPTMKKIKDSCQSTEIEVAGSQSLFDIHCDSAYLYRKTSVWIPPNDARMSTHCERDTVIL